jgi:hypothetical protein
MSLVDILAPHGKHAIFASCLVLKHTYYAVFPASVASACLRCFQLPLAMRQLTTTTRTMETYIEEKFPGIISLSPGLMPYSIAKSTFHESSSELEPLKDGARES